MISKFVEIDPRDNLWICCAGKLLQFSIRKKKVTKNYGHIITGNVKSMVQTSDKKYLFLSGSEGH
jgi:hypothetical protein